MSYTYTDDDGDRLHIAPANNEGFTRYTIIDDEEREHTIFVRNSRVPEVCVAALKVIGLDPKEFPSDHLRQGVWHLAHHVENEAKKEAQRVADEKVLAFCLHTGWTSDPTYKVNNYDRNMYEKAMEFARQQVEEEAGEGSPFESNDALRNLAMGKSLRVLRSSFDMRVEHRLTAWRDVVGLIWEFDEKEKRWKYRHPSHSEGTPSTPTNFPWTEVPA